jgi:PAS domain S-box-containing protein
MVSSQIGQHRTTATTGDTGADASPAVSASPVAARIAPPAPGGRAAFASRWTNLQTFAPSSRAGIGAAAPRRRSVSLAGNLIVLVAAVALPLMVLGAGALWLQYLDQRTSAEAQLVEHARMIARLVDREIGRAQVVAETLAAAVPVARGDLDALEGEFRAAQNLLATSLPPGAPLPMLSLLDAQGRRLLHTSWAPGERRQSLYGTPLSFAAIAEGRPQLSDLFTGPSVSDPVVGVAVPIFAAAPNADARREVIGGIEITVPRERLIAIVSEISLPSGAVASVQDRNGRIVARSVRDAETVGKFPAPGALKAMLGAKSGLAPHGTMTLEKAPSAVAFAHAPRSDYIVAINVPERAFLAPLRGSLVRSATIGVLVLLAGLALAISSARGMVKAFHLALGAAAKGNAKAALPEESTGLREADELAALLATAFAERERAAGNARAMFDKSPIGIIIFDTSGRIHEANDAFLSMVGHTRAELRDGAFNWDEMTPGSRVARDEAAFAEVLATGKCTPYEKEYLRPDGRLVPVLISSGLTDRASGMAATFIMDLTERRLNEAAHRETEERLRFSLHAGRLGAWEFNLATRKIHCSDITKALYGRKPDEDFSVKKLIAAIHSDDRERMQAAVTRAMRGHEDYRIEYRVLWPDHSVHWIEVRGRVFHEGGKPARLAGVSADITERKQAEAALRESETRLRAITDTMPQMVWSARPDGYHDYHNRRWYELTGTTHEQTEGAGWNDAFHPDDRNGAWIDWQHSLATGEPYEVEHRLRTADGSYRWMLGRALPIRDQKTGEILRWFGTCTDIEETIAARDTLARSRDDLEHLVAERTKDLQETQARLAQAQRMEALGQLAGGIAHDFNNVLQAVQGAGALIERSPADTEGARRHARMILEAAERGVAVTRRLLTFSRRGDLQAEPVDPASLHASIRDILAHSLGDGVKVRVELAPDLPPLFADKGQLETVLINLATNGRDAMSGIGTLTLAAAAEKLRPDQVLEHRAGLRAGSYVRLSVSDTGAGMDAGTLAHASEPFFTTKPAGQGTGLGLAMARGFTEQSGGGLLITSAPGCGTTVTLWFPVAEARPSDSAVPFETRAMLAARQRRARLMIVDDDAIVREVTAELMEASGFIVLSAESGMAALAVLNAGAEVDLLVSDLSMPEMDGVTLIKEAQRLRPGLPAILLTGFATNAAELAVGGALSGAFSLLRKPVQGAHLAERVAALLETRSARV